MGVVGDRGRGRVRLDVNRTLKESLGPDQRLNLEVGCWVSLETERVGTGRTSTTTGRHGSARGAPGR